MWTFVMVKEEVIYLQLTDLLAAEMKGTRLERQNFFLTFQKNENFFGPNQSFRRE